MLRVSLWIMAELLCACTKAAPRDERPSASSCSGGKAVSADDPVYGSHIKAWREFAKRRFRGELVWTCAEGRMAPPDRSLTVVLSTQADPVCWVPDCTHLADLSCRAGLHISVGMEITSDQGLLKQYSPFRLMATGPEEAEGLLVEGDITDPAVRAAFASPDAQRLQQDVKLTVRGSEVSLDLDYIEERPTGDHGVVGRGVCAAHVVLQSGV